MDVTSKIEDLTRKQAATEEKISKLECKDILLSEEDVRERKFKKKVLLMQHCDVKIRLRNLRSMLKEKSRANQPLSQNELKEEKSPTKNLIDDTESEAEINQDESFTDVSDEENDVDESDCSLDETFYTACDSVDSDIAAHLDEVDDEDELSEDSRGRPVVALQPVLELQKTQLDLETNKKCLTEEEKTESDLELECRVSQWVRKNKRSIIQQVKLKLAEEQEMSSSSAGQGQGE